MLGILKQNVLSHRNSGPDKCIQWLEDTIGAEMYRGNGFILMDFELILALTVFSFSIVNMVPISLLANLLLALYVSRKK